MVTKVKKTAQTSTRYSSGLHEMVGEVEVKGRGEKIDQTSACRSSGLVEMVREVEAKVEVKK